MPPYAVVDEVNSHYLDFSTIFPVSSMSAALLAEVPFKIYHMQDNYATFI